MKYICSIVLGLLVFVCHAQDDKRIMSLADLKEEDILPMDTLWRVFDTQPTDSLSIYMRAAYDSLANYMLDFYMHNKRLRGPLPDKMIHYKFWFECIFDRYGNILSVKGRYGKGNDPMEDVLVDYLMKMPRYEEWEVLSKCFSYKAVTVGFPVVF